MYSKYLKYKKKYTNLKRYKGLKGSANKNQIKMDRYKVFGCLYGVCVGDALGSRYEFLEHHDAVTQVNKDMKNGKLKLLGGGPFKIAPGQITDDSEMTLSLLRSIAQVNGYDQKDVAQKYLEWFNTKPVDVGKTTFNALYTRKPSVNYKDLISNSQELNYSSLSNGVLMRISPICIYALKLNDTELHKIIDQECDLTHPNPIIKDAVYIYCLAVKYALLGLDKKTIYQEIIKRSNEPRTKIILKDALDRPEPTYVIDEYGNEMYVQTDDIKFQGYFGIALQNAFYEFLNTDNYQDSIVHIIQRGGDTDTNCAIAGGLIGAFYGVNSFNHYVEIINHAQYERIKKYPFLAVKNINTYVNSIFS
jgi:ADP-ribosyl-[dinitrogen reductase] hydrolase